MTQRKPTHGGTYGAAEIPPREKTCGEARMDQMGKSHVIRLKIEDYAKCANIWDMERDRALAERFYRELCNGNRITYVWEADGAFLGEISLRLHMDEPGYTEAGRRIYLSRLIVKPEYQRRGIGRALTRHVVARARDLGYREMSLGVDLGNYSAVRLYVSEGFDRILEVTEDQYGPYLKLIKIL